LNYKFILIITFFIIITTLILYNFDVCKTANSPTGLFTLKNNLGCIESNNCFISNNKSYCVIICEKSRDLD